MLSIVFPQQEFYDETTNTFIIMGEKTVNFEYSLYAVSKWEAKWKTPFLSTELSDTDERLIDFYVMMGDDKTLTPEEFTPAILLQIKEYIEDPHTATRINEQQEAGRGKVYTAEEFYAIMAMNGVPLEFEHRNLHNLLVILKVISVYNNPNPKKMPRSEVLSQNAQLNRMRREQYKTRG